MKLDPILKAAALNELKRISDTHDMESGHLRADELLLELIDDLEITAAYEALDKWYA